MLSKPLAVFAAGAIAVALAAGCTKGSDQSTSSSSTTTTSSDTSAPVASSPDAGASAKGMAMGDPARGKTIFSANCSSCHGASGTEGGVGPSLKGEKSKKNYAQTIAWIHNPAPPMPKLWPSPLNDKDVADVASYVQSL